jgi:hypothetical protein
MTKVRRSIADEGSRFGEDFFFAMMKGRAGRGGYWRKDSLAIYRIIPD